MLKAPNTPPSDPIELRSTAEGLVALAKSQALEIEKLKHQLNGHQRHRFGARSESADQLNLRLEEEETAAASKPQCDLDSGSEVTEKPKRKPLPPTLPRKEEVLAPGENCTCGGKPRLLGEDVKEELEYRPGQFIVNRIVRPRLACNGCDQIVQAPIPSRPIERGRSGPGLLAHVLGLKYADHCPLHHQSQIFEREGIDLGRSTLASWAVQSSKFLEPLAPSRQYSANAPAGQWTPSGVMPALAGPSLQTIRPSSCRRRANARRPVFGPICPSSGTLGQMAA